MNGNNVMEGDAINRSNVCTSCTNDDNENKYGHVLMSIGYYCMQQYSVYKHLASFVRSSFTLMKTQDWVETSVFFDNDICPTISASGVSLSVIRVANILLFASSLIRSFSQPENRGLQLGIGIVGW